MVHVRCRLLGSWLVNYLMTIQVGSMVLSIIRPGEYIITLTHSLSSVIASVYVWTYRLDLNIIQHGLVLSNVTYELSHSTGLHMNTRLLHKG